MSVWNSRPLKSKPRNVDHSTIGLNRIFSYSGTWLLNMRLIEAVGARELMLTAVAMVSFIEDIVSCFLSS